MSKSSLFRLFLECCTMTTAPIKKVQKFQKVFQSGLKSHGRFHSSHVLIESESDESPLVRVAVVAAKKAVGKRAVMRNRAKRRLRPLMRTLVFEFRHDGTLPDESLNWVVRAKSSCLSCTSEELHADLRNALIGLLDQATRRSKKRNHEGKAHQNHAAGEAASCKEQR